MKSWIFVYIALGLPLGLVPIDYLIQCWLIVNSTNRNTMKYFLNWKRFHQRKYLWNCLCKVSAILLRSRFWIIVQMSWHDDVIKWKHFPHYWPFVRGIPGHRWIPHTKASDAELWCFDLRLNKWLSKQSGGWNLRRHHAHYDVIVMGGLRFSPLQLNETLLVDISRICLVIFILYIFHGRGYSLIFWGAMYVCLKIESQSETENRSPCGFDVGRKMVSVFFTSSIPEATTPTRHIYIIYIYIIHTHTHIYIYIRYMYVCETHIRTVYISIKSQSLQGISAKQWKITPKLHMT